MSKLYLNLDDAVDRVILLSKQYGNLGVYGENPHDKQWLRNELEQICDIRSCEMCRGAIYTAEPFPVVTKMGRTIETVFNFCPVCGRDLRPDMVDAWGEGESE